MIRLKSSGKNPTADPLELTRRKRKDFNPAINSESPRKSKKEIIVVITGNNENLIKSFLEISKKYLTRRKNIELKISTEIPGSVLSEAMVREQNKKYLIIFFDIYREKPTFNENSENLEALSSNGFEIRSVRHKVENDLLLEAEDWFQPYLQKLIDIA
jgi:hypothetical protein